MPKGKIDEKKRRINVGWTFSSGVVAAVESLSKRSNISPGRLAELALEKNLDFLERYVSALEETEDTFKQPERKIA